MTRERDKMVSEGIGYRCPSYSEGGHTGPGPLDDILEFEQCAGNDHVIEDINRVLGLNILLEDVVDEDWWEIRNAVKEMCGEVSALWLTTEEAARSRYCIEGEDPVPVRIPKCAIPASDLGEDGTLFLYPEGCTEDRKDKWLPTVAITRLDSPQLREYLANSGVVFDDVNKTPWIKTPNKTSGKVIADIYIDDRALKFNGDWKEMPEKVKDFRPWYRR